MSRMTSSTIPRSNDIQVIDRIHVDSIRTIVERIANRFVPEKIILFGSQAYGKPDQSSDLDLLVILETPNGELETALMISDSLPPHAFRIDIIAKSREAIEDRISLGDSFTREVMSRGKILYARHNERMD